MASTNTVVSQVTDNRSMSEKIATYLSLKAKEAALKEELKNLEANIKAGMGDLTEIRETGFVAMIEVGTQRKFDTNRFKADHFDIYESYRHDVATHSFKAYVEG